MDNILNNLCVTLSYTARLGDNFLTFSEHPSFTGFKALQLSSPDATYCFNYILTAEPPCSESALASREQKYHNQPLGSGLGKLR